MGLLDIFRFKKFVAAGAVGLAAAGADAAPPELRQRLEAHVRAIASSEHNTAHPKALEASARYIESSLSALGLKVLRQEFRAGGQPVRNIEVILGESGPAQRVYIVGAHYDSAPGAPGANDNGSGSAALLELARLFKSMKLPASVELRLVFYVNEEPPYFMGPDMGSMRHAKLMREQKQSVKGVWILETIGHYSKQRNSQRYPPGLEERFRHRRFSRHRQHQRGIRPGHPHLRGLQGQHGFSCPGAGRAGCYPGRDLVRPRLLPAPWLSRADDDRHGLHALSALPHDARHATRRPAWQGSSKDWARRQP